MVHEETEEVQILIGPEEDLAFFAAWAEENGLSARVDADHGPNQLVLDGFSGKEHLLDELVRLTIERKFRWVGRTEARKAVNTEVGQGHGKVAIV